MRRTRSRSPRSRSTAGATDSTSRWSLSAIRRPISEQISARSPPTSKSETCGTSAPSSLRLTSSRFITSRTIACEARTTSSSDSRSSSGSVARPCTYCTLDRMLERGFLRSWTMRAVSSSFCRCAASSASRCVSITRTLVRSSSESSLIRSSDRTRMRSSVRLRGLVRKSSAPDSSAALWVSRSPSAVRNSTGTSPPSGSARIRRQVSYPSIPGINTSSSTRSGRRVPRNASASAPPSAWMTAYPALTRCPSATSRFCRLSSTTRTVAAGLPPSAHPADTLGILLAGGGAQERLDDGAERPGVDRLRQVALEAAAEQALAIARHRQRGDGDDRNLRRRRARPGVANHRLGAAARDLHVEQQQVERLGVERAPGLVDGGRLDHLVPAQLEQIVHQQPVERVVLDDENAGARGSVLGERISVGRHHPGRGDDAPRAPPWVFGRSRGGLYRPSIRRRDAQRRLRAAP